jgi:hypothetical protein
MGTCVGGGLKAIRWHAGKLNRNECRNVMFSCFFNLLYKCATQECLIDLLKPEQKKYTKNEFSQTTNNALLADKCSPISSKNLVPVTYYVEIVF